MARATSFAAGLVGDGRPLLTAGALALVASGVVAAFLGLTRAMLPHDVAWLGLAADELAALADGRVLDFMVHDRVAFGGALVGVGVLHLWLVVFGWHEGVWAWIALAASAGAGFVSFLAFLGYGYLDTWHAGATVGVLPLYAGGLLRTLPRWPAAPTADHPRPPGAWRRRLPLLLATSGLVGGGLAVLGVGATVVFVPQDLVFLDRTASELAAVSDRLIPLIAHDRASFGGAVLATGVAAFPIALLGRPSRHRTEALALAGLAGFGGAIGIHVLVGYLDAVHLGPAVVGALLFGSGLAVDRPTAIGRCRERAVEARREVVGRRVGGQVDQPRPVARRDRGVGPRMVDELVGRRQRPHHLLVEARQHAADRRRQARARAPLPGGRRRLLGHDAIDGVGAVGTASSAPRSRPARLMRSASTPAVTAIQPART